MQYLLHLEQMNTYRTPLTNLATLIFKVLRLSQTSFELSSSKGVFGSQENERKKREKRENCKPKNKSCVDFSGMKVRVKKCHKVAYIAIQDVLNTKNTKNI